MMDFWKHEYHLWFPPTGAQFICPVQPVQAIFDLIWTKEKRNLRNSLAKLNSCFLGFTPAAPEPGLCALAFSRQSISPLSTDHVQESNSLRGLCSSSIKSNLEKEVHTIRTSFHTSAFISALEKHTGSSSGNCLESFTCHVFKHIFLSRPQGKPVSSTHLTWWTLLLLKMKQRPGPAIVQECSQDSPALSTQAQKRFPCCFIPHKDASFCPKHLRSAESINGKLSCSVLSWGHTQWCSVVTPSSAQGSISCLGFNLGLPHAEHMLHPVHGALSLDHDNQLFKRAFWEHP